MNIFDVYPRFNVTPTRAQGVYLYDENDEKYLDLYGGHGVISIGHNHPHYLKRLEEQLHKIGFYSNSVNMPLQNQLAEALGAVSGYEDYQLFLCNSGAEANENALKLASFHNGKKKIIAFNGSFHGRTGAALNVTQNKKLSAPINRNNFPVETIDINSIEQLKAVFESGEVCAVIVEGIQGVGGLDMPDVGFLKKLSATCKAHKAVLILDEIQSGFGRSGKFFAHQFGAIKPDIITIAKGMGNGFPVAGVLINPQIKASYGLLGTTFGGNHLACAAALSVLETFISEDLINHAASIGEFLMEELSRIPKVKKVKGRGLMLGLEFDFPVKTLRSRLLEEDFIFTGAAANPNILRILPPLSITKNEVTPFIEALRKQLS